MANIYQPNDRYAFVGKTGSGKTGLAIVFASTIALALLQSGWEVWWIDTKGDPKDRAALRTWGFRNGASANDLITTKMPNAKYFLVEAKRIDGKNLSIVVQAQQIMRAAYVKGKVVVVVDEYTQVVPSTASPGPALKDIFTRGRGKNVGIIGLTQEPVNIPRMLLSQASHIAAFNLTYEYDIEYIQKRVIRQYQPPFEKGDKYGFYWKWVEGPNTDVQYWADQSEWYKQLAISRPGKASFKPGSTFARPDRSGELHPSEPLKR